MLNHDPFYHETIRSAIVGFGKMFSDIKIVRKSEGATTTQEIAVPIAYGPKEKWVIRLDQDPDLDQHTYTTLPRLSFEMAGISYDPLRKTGRINSIVKNNTQGRTKVWAPVPYNLDITLSALTKTTEDGLQIVEQILPYFTPEFTMSIRSTQAPIETITDVPIILNSVSFIDDYDGTFDIRRFVTWTLNFTLKVNLFAGVDQNASVITKTIVDLGDPDVQHIAEGDLNTFEIIKDEWDEERFKPNS